METRNQLLSLKSFSYISTVAGTATIVPRLVNRILTHNYEKNCGIVRRGH